ncbi:TM2 domain-containing protein [Stieleria sp. TO1_6]|uniref:TM2 domain-containing protein n=1 Tax=Stieleria tagensis TaxID=2956795 RepID=UPI00209B138A|nr:TM2 domain-containing protein [Stieleria tagensis]MCO8124440.1 TM2 domain-containing protein [Stieleria tagensis]
MHSISEPYPYRGELAYQDSSPTHPVLFAYLYWILGIFGAHRFYLGRPITGAIWFFTGGVFLVGWIVDLFLIPAMSEQASQRYRSGSIDYSVAWGLHTFLGLFGVHRFYMGKIFTGVLYLLTGGLLGVGFVYDLLTLNEQIDELNVQN